AVPRERTDASLRVIGAVAASTVIGVAVALLAARQICLKAPGPGRAAALGSAGLFQHGPAEKTAIAQDWARLDRQEAERLHGYGWVDRRAGVVRIPIERAMERLAERKQA